MKVLEALEKLRQMSRSNVRLTAEEVADKVRKGRDGDLFDEKELRRKFYRRDKGLEGVKVVKVMGQMDWNIPSNSKTQNGIEAQQETGNKKQKQEETNTKIETQGPDKNTKIHDLEDSKKNELLKLKLQKEIEIEKRRIAKVKSKQSLSGMRLLKRVIRKKREDRNQSPIKKRIKNMSNPGSKKDNIQNLIKPMGGLVEYESDSDSSDGQ